MSRQSNAPTVPDARSGHGDHGDGIVRKVGRRLMWFLMAMYFVSILDRGNVSFAAISMNKDLGLTSQMFGIGVGVFFLAYALFEVPSNLILARFGARVTLTRIAFLWGLATMLMAFTQGPLSFYALRALLGFAEAGLLPGAMLYLSYWIPYSYRARYNAMFNYAIPASYVFASILSGIIMELHGTLGLPGWKWLFMLEGLPAIVLGAVGVFHLTNRPKDAAWLEDGEKAWLQQTIDAENREMSTVRDPHLLKALFNPMVLLLAVTYVGVFAGLSTLAPWLPQIVRKFGVPVHVVGYITAIPPLGGLIGMHFMSRRSDFRRERVNHTVASLLIAAAGYLLIYLAPSQPLIVLGFVIGNVGVYAAASIFWTIPQSYLSQEVAPGAIGVISALGSLAGAIIPVFMGRMNDRAHHLTDGFIIVVGVFVVASVAAFAAGCLLRKQRGTAD